MQTLQMSKIADFYHLTTQISFGFLGHVIVKLIENFLWFFIIQ